MSRIALKQLNDESAISGNVIGFNSSSNAWEPQSVASSQEQIDSFAPATDQTVFTLSQTPSDANDVRMGINGQILTNGPDYQVTGTTATYLEPNFSLKSTDSVQFIYEFGGVLLTSTQVNDENNILAVQIFS